MIFMRVRSRERQTVGAWSLTRPYVPASIVGAGLPRPIWDLEALEAV